MTTAIETTIAQKTEHQIPSALLQKKVRITVVGCGGTGSAIAAGLPYLHQTMVALGHPHGLDVTLVDGDRISHTNCVRQPFSESEIGLHKATVLATRINLFWGLGWKGVPHFVDETWGQETDILIGCVDSRAARNAMTRTPTYQALAMLARLFRYGRLAYHGGFVNLRTGRTAALPVDPVVWERMAGGGLGRARSKVSPRLASPLLS